MEADLELLLPPMDLCGQMCPTRPGVRQRSACSLENEDTCTKARERLQQKRISELGKTLVLHAGFFIDITHTQ